MVLDSYFTYKYNLRFLLVNKIGILKNTFSIPYFNKVVLFFNLNRLEDIDHIQLYNNFYLFKFFFGKNAFFSRTKKFFLLGTWYYNFNVQLIINNSKEINFILYFFFNNISINVEKNLFKTGILNKKLNIFFILLKDLNIYSELKTNLGLFNIKRPLNIKLFINGGCFLNSKLLLSNCRFA